ncbi:hypothetical protein D3C78_1895360 [compost metagenome]
MYSPILAFVMVPSWMNADRMNVCPFSMANGVETMPLIRLTKANRSAKNSTCVCIPSGVFSTPTPMPAP